MPGFSLPKPAGLASDCFVVWETNSADAAMPLDKALPLAGYAGANLSGSGQDVFLTHSWPKQWYSDSGRSTTWGARRLDPQTPICQ